MAVTPFFCFLMILATEQSKKLARCDTYRYWSTAYQPTLRPADYQEAIFVPARAG